MAICKALIVSEVNDGMIILKVSSTAIF